ncbi:MAG: hypothetical protein ACRD2J_01845 [Thermoanaerobaculia bacterium]
MLRAVLLAAVLLTDLPIDRIVLLSGHQIPVSGDVLIDDDRLIFRNVAGVLYSIHIDEVDMPATLASGDLATEDVENTTNPRRGVRKLTVSDEEKERLLERLAANRKDEPSPPAEGGMSDEQVAEELERSEQRKEEAREEEAYWRAQAGAARDRLESARAQVETLEQRERQLDSQIRLMHSAGYPPETMTAQLFELERTRSQLDAARLGLGRAQREWNDLQNRARRDGALPGWLR